MEVNYRIGTGSKIALLSVAILFDLIGIILLLVGVGLFINTILAILFALYSGFIFLLRGVPILSFRRARSWFISMIGEAIPVVNALPMCVFSTIYIIKSTNKEDRQKAA